MAVLLKKYQAYLKSKGLYIKRTKSSHQIWDMKDNSLERPIVVDTNYKDVPETHILTNLRTLGISKKEFYEEIKTF